MIRETTVAAIAQVRRRKNEKEMKKNARIITASAAIIMLWYHGLYSPSYLNAKNIKTFNGSKPRIYNTNRHTKRKSGNQKVSLAVSHRIALHHITSHRIGIMHFSLYAILRSYSYALNSIHLLFDSNRQEWQQTIIIQSSIETCFFIYSFISMKCERKTRMNQNEPHFCVVCATCSCS